MILFMEYSGKGKRGGERYNARLHSFLVSKFPNTKPEKLTEIPLEISSPVKHARYSLGMVKNYNPDLVVLDISSGCRNVLAVRWMKKRKKRVMVIVQGQRMEFKYDNALLKLVVHHCENYLLKNSDIVLVNSKFTASQVRKRVSMNVPVLIAYPGLWLSVMPSKKTNVLIENKVRINLLFVGECTKVKGLKFLIEALCFLKDLDFGLDIVGWYSPDSPYFRNIATIISRNNLDEKVRFHGFVDNHSLFDFYAKCTILVMPSLSEGYGMVLAEALCFGLPIVASKAGAIPEMVVDGVNAILVKPGDSQALAEAIRALASDRALREKMSKANLERSKTLPQWDDFDRVLETRLGPIIENLTGLKPGL